MRRLRSEVMSLGKKITIEEIKNGWLVTDSTTKDKVHYRDQKKMVEEVGLLTREKQTELNEP
jgi:hypothetical protein